MLAGAGYGVSLGMSMNVDRLDRCGPVDGPVQKAHNLRSTCGPGPMGPVGPVEMEGGKVEKA